MNKTFVASLENHNVYLISNDNIAFYLNISKKREATSITLDIEYRKKSSVNDMITYYQKLDNYNITLIVPLEKFTENREDFKKQSNIISSVINLSYQLLTRNGVTIKNEINVIKHSNIKSEFVQFFTKKFANRIRFVYLDMLVQEEIPYNKLNAANISFVVGKPELDLTVNDEEMREILEEVSSVSEQENPKPSVQKFSFGSISGFVSYYLLGFLAAIIVLFVISLILK